MDKKELTREECLEALLKLSKKEARKKRDVVFITSDDYSLIENEEIREFFEIVLIRK